MIRLNKHFFDDSHLFKAKILSISFVCIIELCHVADLSVLFLLRVTFLDKPSTDLNLHIFFIEIFNVRFNELESISHLRDLSHLDIVSFIVTIENILFDGGIEKERLLHNYSNLLSQLSNIVVTDINSIDKELTASKIIEP